MFERFSEHARRALFFSRHEALRAGKQLIESEHILLGILREGDPVTSELWRMFNVEPEVLRAEFPTIEERISFSADVPISEGVKRIFVYATEEAEKRNEAVEPHHLVLAILRFPECPAARLLAERGVEYELVSEAARQIYPAIRKREEIEERTPIILRQSHYALFDRLAESIPLRELPRTYRPAIALAVIDAFAESSLTEQKFASLDELRTALRNALK